MWKCDVFDVGVSKKDLEGGRVGMVGGEGDGVEKMGGVMDKGVKVGCEGELSRWGGEVDGKGVMVWCRGMGGGCRCIGVEEVGEVGIGRLVGMGRRGGIEGDINVGDVVVRRGCVGVDGGRVELGGVELGGVGDLECRSGVVEGGKWIGGRSEVGVRGCCDRL